MNNGTALWVWVLADHRAFEGSEVIDVFVLRESGEQAAGGRDLRLGEPQRTPTSTAWRVLDGERSIDTVTLEARVLKM